MDLKQLLPDLQCKQGEFLWLIGAGGTEERKAASPSDHLEVGPEKGHTKQFQPKRYPTAPVRLAHMSLSSAEYHLLDCCHPPSHWSKRQHDMEGLYHLPLSLPRHSFPAGPWSQACLAMQHPVTQWIHSYQVSKVTPVLMVGMQFVVNPWGLWSLWMKLGGRAACKLWCPPLTWKAGLHLSKPNNPGLRAWRVFPFSAFSQDIKLSSTFPKTLLWHMRMVFVSRKPKAFFWCFIYF